ncbi:hypothetical protein chiPu_0007879 [Chiloscyllium punctatum]|uniref:UPAR/Ly6 domain-containing protein n=1 Tax=Chiloscyllium punctatum TaxID=137246 RepID=A0A401SGA6_CHIPU|nr:hypothetical protein [Chiloscyllium punctatum]
MTETITCRKEMSRCLTISTIISAEGPSNVNSLECYTSSPEVSNIGNILKCTGTQDSCFKVSVGSGFERGCTCRNNCRVSDPPLLGTNVSTPNCCETNFCNKATLFPDAGRSAEFRRK